LGALLVQNNANFTTSSTYAIIPSGLFRSIGGTNGGSGTIAATTLASLSDVNITEGSGIDQYALMWNNATTKWIASNNLGVSITGNAATATSASYATTSSYVLNTVSSSYATTASYWSGSILNSTSASYASTASYVTTAQTASYYGGSVTSASYASTASYVLNAISSSYSSNSTSASYATTSSYVITAQTASYYGGSVTSASYASTASYVLQAVSASFAILAQTANTASYVVTAQTASYWSGSILNATSASYASTASYVTTAQTSSYYGGSVTSASYASTASYVQNAVSSSYATNATTAQTASYANATPVTGFTIGGSQIYYANVSSPGNVNSNIFSTNTGSFTSAFYNYTVSSGSNARSGQVIAAWVGTTSSYTDFSTVDIGSTSAVTASIAIVTGQIQFNMQVPAGTWIIKSTATYL